MRTDAKDFLIERMVKQHLAGSARRCHGISSDALAMYAAGLGPRPRTPGTPTAPGFRSWSGEECAKNHPVDVWDLMACERTYRMAPDGLQARMLPVLEEFRAWVLEGRNRYGERVMTPPAYYEALYSEQMRCLRDEE